MMNHKKNATNDETEEETDNAPTSAKQKKTGERDGQQKKAAEPKSDRGKGQKNLVLHNLHSHK